MWESFACWHAVNRPVAPPKKKKKTTSPSESTGEILRMRSPITHSLRLAGGRGFLLLEGGDPKGALKPLVPAGKLRTAERSAKSRLAKCHSGQRRQTGNASIFYQRLPLISTLNSAKHHRVCRSFFLFFFSLHFFVGLVNSLSLLCYICHPAPERSHQEFEPFFGASK